MVKVDVVKILSEKTNISQKDCDTVLKAFLETVQEQLAKGEKISFVGFGTFEVVERAAREGTNPRTKEKIQIPATKVPVFKAGKPFKETIKNN